MRNFHVSVKLTTWLVTNPVGLILITILSGTMLQCAENKTGRVSACSEFDLKNLVSEDYQVPDSLRVVDKSSFGKELLAFSEFSSLKDYQTLYNYCEVEFGNGLTGRVVLQRVHNDSELNLFLIYKDNGDSNQFRVFQLAKLQKSPEDLSIVKSTFVDNATIRKTSIFFSTGDLNFKDSVVSTYTLDRQGFFVKSKADSVRTMLN